MAFESIVLAMQVFSLLFIFISLLYMVKNRIFERSVLESSVTSMIFGLFLLLLMFVFAIINTLVAVAPGIFAGMAGLSTALSYLNLISALGIMPLYAACVLVAILLARDKLGQEH